MYIHIHIILYNFYYVPSSILASHHRGSLQVTTHVVTLRMKYLLLMRTCTQNAKMGEENMHGP